MSDHTTFKTCTQCGETKPATPEYFHRSGNTLRSYCRVCQAEYRKTYYARNAEKAKADARAHYASNLEENKQRAKEYRLKNAEKESARGKAYREKNAESRKALFKAWYQSNAEKQKEYRRKNADKINARSKAWSETNAERVKANHKTYYTLNKAKIANKAKIWGKAWRDANPQKAKAASQRRAARKRGLPDTLTAAQWEYCLVYFGNVCAACGRGVGLFHTLASDHFIPLSSPNCPGTVAANIIPLCNGLGGCNNSKGDKDALEWATEKFGPRKAKLFMSKIEAYFASLEGETQ